MDREDIEIGGTYMVKLEGIRMPRKVRITGKHIFGGWTGEDLDGMGVDCRIRFSENVLSLVSPPAAGDFAYMGSLVAEYNRQRA